MPEMVLERYAEMIFEDINFNACFMTSGASMLARYASNVFKDFDSNLCLVLDSGFSFTYGVPVL